VTRRLLAPLLCLLPTLTFAWSPVTTDTPASPKHGGFVVTLPEGWLYNTDSTGVFASHDGEELDHISVQIIPHKAIFKNIKKVSSADMSPEDLAENYLASLQANSNVLEVALITSEPGELAGKPAFGMHLKYRTPPAQGDAQMEFTALGTPLSDGVLLATYRAPSIHFYGKWFGAFETALKSVQLAPKR
jgi:hypothetical protein